MATKMLLDYCKRCGANSTRDVKVKNSQILRSLNFCLFTFHYLCMLKSALLGCVQMPHVVEMKYKNNMAMKRIITTVLSLVLMLLCASTGSAQSDFPKTSNQSVVGKWSHSEETDDNLTMTMTLVFNSNGMMELRLDMRGTVENMVIMTGFASVPGKYILDGNTMKLNFDQSKYYFSKFNYSLTPEAKQLLTDNDIKMLNDQLKPVLSQLDDQLKEMFDQSISGIHSDTYVVTENELAFDDTVFKNDSHFDDLVKIWTPQKGDAKSTSTGKKKVK